MFHPPKMVVTFHEVCLRILPRDWSSFCTYCGVGSNLQRYTRKGSSNRWCGVLNFLFFTGVRCNRIFESEATFRSGSRIGVARDTPQSRRKHRRAATLNETNLDIVILEPL